MKPNLPRRSRQAPLLITPACHPCMLSPRNRLPPSSRLAPAPLPFPPLLLLAAVLSPLLLMRID